MEPKSSSAPCVSRSGIFGDILVWVRRPYQPLRSGHGSWLRLAVWFRWALDGVAREEGGGAAVNEWATHDESQDYLLPSGGRLNEAVELLRAWHVPLEDAVARFIEISERAEKRRRTHQLRRAWAIAVSMTVFGLFAIGSAVFEFNKQTQAELEQRQALVVAEKMLANGEKGLGQATGVPTAMVESMLSETDSVLTGLAERQADPIWLNTVRARTLLAFTDAFGKTGNDALRLDKARQAERLAENLTHSQGRSPAQAWDLLASTHAAVGDALMATNAFDDARHAYAKALAIRQRPTGASDDGLEKAVAAYEKAISMFESLTKQPQADAQKDLAAAANLAAWTIVRRPSPTPEEQRTALDMATRASMLAGEMNPRYLDTLALAHAALGHIEGARAACRKALQFADALEPSHLDEIVAHCARIEQ